jgi:hypothetical protein
MRRTLYFAVFLVVGCQGVVGPREHRDHPVRVDTPCLDIEDQKRLGRDRLALPVTTPDVGPGSSADLHGPYNR